MQQSVTYLDLKLCGLASSKTHGNGQMEESHHFVSGNPDNHITLKIRSVLLQFLKTRGCGITGTATWILILFVKAVSCLPFLVFVFCVGEVIV